MCDAAAYQMAVLLIVLVSRGLHGPPLTPWLDQVRRREGGRKRLNSLSGEKTRLICMAWLMRTDRGRKGGSKGGRNRESNTRMKVARKAGSENDAWLFVFDRNGVASNWNMENDSNTECNSCFEDTSAAEFFILCVLFMSILLAFLLFNS